MKGQVKFNTFVFISTFARSLVEIFITIFLFNNGCSIRQIALFYILVNLFSLPISYLFVKIGEKTKYVYLQVLSLIGFVGVQILLNIFDLNIGYIALMALCYSVYRRGYWVSRRFYITNIMPNKNSSWLYSFVSVMNQLAAIAAGYVGSYLLSGFNNLYLTILSSVLLLVGAIPLFFIKYEKNSGKIHLLESLKNYKIENYLVFASYELNNTITFLFPIYIALYISNEYKLVGNLNAISNIANIVFILVIGKILNKYSKNKGMRAYTLSTILLMLCFFLKTKITTEIILVVYFIEGLVSKMQTQAESKIYFENRGDMDLMHYNLVYQLLEGLVRAVALIPGLFIDDIIIILYIEIGFVLALLLTSQIVVKVKKHKEKM